MVAMDWGPWGGGDRGALGIYRRIETVAGLFRRKSFFGRWLSLLAALVSCHRVLHRQLRECTYLPLRAF